MAHPNDDAHPELEPEADGPDPFTNGVDRDGYPPNSGEVDQYDHLPEPEDRQDGDDTSEHDDEPDGDDVCDLCMASGVNVDRTTPCGKTIGIECGCDEENEDGTCGDPDCEECNSDDREPPEDHFRDDVEADADTLASAGYGCDEDYGFASDVY